MGVWSDAKGVFDCRCTRGVRIARDSCFSAGDGEGRDGNRFQDADYRPVPGMEERVKSKDFAGWKARCLRTAENELGRECVREEPVDRRHRDGRIACADVGEKIQYQRGVVAGREMDRLSVRSAGADHGNARGQEAVVCDLGRRRRSATAGEPKRLTEGDKFSLGEFSWSPDGTRIAFSAQKDPDLISSETADLYVVTVSDGALKKIVSTPGPDTNPRWSPDGKKIAFETAAGGKYYFYTNVKIAVVAAEGGTPEILTEAFDEDPGLIGWGPDGIYFAAEQKTFAHLFRLNPATKAVEKLSAPDRMASVSFSLSQDYRQAAYRAALENQYAEIYSSNVVPWQGKKLTAMGDQLKGFTLAHREVTSWKSADGTTIEGVVYKPAGFDPRKKYPLLVVIHGGPTGADQPIVNADRYYPLERFVAKGALVLKPNYRGSAGYGEKFRALNVRNLGVGDYADVISGVDALIAKGWVDKDRLGSMGWSQGGYISAFITASSNRFKAVSVGAGISDWMTYYANTDITPFTPQYLHATPWDDPEIYRKTSP